MNKNFKLKIKNFSIFALLISLVIFRYFSTHPVFKNGDFVRITLIVFSEPVDYTSSQFLKIFGLKIYLPKVPEISYGDKIIVEGIVDGDKLKNPKLIKVIATKNFLSNFHNNLVSFYQKVLPEPDAGLLAGIVIGAKGSLSSDFWEKVKKAGVAHVVVASGMNVIFVASFLMGIVTVYLPRRKAIALVVAGILAYLFVSGFDAPLVRAAVMSGVAFSAQELGRLASTWRIFLTTAGLMLLVRPDWVTDVGFILSFVATGSLLLFEKRIRDKIRFVPEFLKEGLSTSLAAQIGVAPILFVTFGQFNPFSPLINGLVLWVVPPLMIIGAVGGAIGLILPEVGKLILYLGYPLTRWFIGVVRMLG